MSIKKVKKFLMNRVIAYVIVAVSFMSGGLLIGYCLGLQNKTYSERDYDHLHSYVKKMVNDNWNEREIIDSCISHITQLWVKEKLKSRELRDYAWKLEHRIEKMKKEKK
jgi:hypothetical protein